MLLRTNDVSSHWGLERDETELLLFVTLDEDDFLYIGVLGEVVVHLLASVRQVQVSYVDLSLLTHDFLVVDEALFVVHGSLAVEMLTLELVLTIEHL